MCEYILMRHKFHAKTLLSQGEKFSELNIPFPCACVINYRIKYNYMFMRKLMIHFDFVVVNV